MTFIQGWSPAQPRPIYELIIDWELDTFHVLKNFETSDKSTTVQLKVSSTNFAGLNRTTGAVYLVYIISCNPFRGKHDSVKCEMNAFVYHSYCIGDTNVAEKIRRLGLGISVPGQMLGKIKVRHDEPSEEENRREG